MAYIQEKDRNQFVIESLDTMVSETSIVRIIDAFVENIDMKQLQFTKSERINEGRPSYNPKNLLKLYIWGYKNGIHSSRKLAEQCKVNIEIMWLIGKLTPDFRTISDFRKDNVESIKKVFYEFNKKIFTEIELGFQSIDGSKIQANNSKERNFTQNKLDDRIKWIKNHIEDYLKMMDKIDANESVDENGEFTKEELEYKLNEIKERLTKYEEYKKYMEKNNLSQLSLTDKDAKLMKSKNGFIVGYNVQTAVDSNTHLITDYNVTDHVTDHGLIENTVTQLKEEQYKDKVMEIVADNGYETKKDILNCLEKGIIPNVINNKKEYQLELDYKQDKCNPQSKEPQEISKCLHNGIIPEIYKDRIKDIKITTGKTKLNNTTKELNKIFANKDEMISKAKEGYFIRDAENNIVYCPNNQILKQVAITPKDEIKYRNKFACKNCPYKNKCFNGNVKYKDINFTKDTIIKPAKWKIISEMKINNKTKLQHCKTIITKKVKFTFVTDKAKMSQRFCLSEHPFGTIKRTLNGSYFLLKNKIKVNAEFALLSLNYNLQRIVHIMGFNKIMQLMTVQI